MICKINIQINQAYRKMNQDHFQKPITCFLHKKERATHICSDLRCHNNPLLCGQCFLQHNLRTLHGSHEALVQPIPQGIQRIAGIIKSQTKDIEKIYNTTLGQREHQNMIKNIAKGDQVYEELENRIKTLKTQVQLELELLIKDFQKRILLQKEQFFKILDSYQKNYVQNYQRIREYTEDVLDFQKGLKLYANSNNLFLKLAHQTRKKSLQWFIQQKKSLNSLSRAMENSHYSIELSKVIQSYASMNLDKLPVWMGDQIPEQKTKDLSFWLSKTIQGWIKIPQMKNPERGIQKYGQHYSYRT